MTPRLVLAWTLTLAACGVILFKGAARHAAAAQAAESARSDLARAAADLRELAALKAEAGEGAGAPASSQTSTEGLARSVSETLAECGLPAGVLESLTPPEAAPGARLLTAPGTQSAETAPTARRARATVVLKGLTLAQLGRVLDALTRRRPEWKPVGIDLGKDQTVKPTPGEDLPLRAALTLEALIIEQPPSPQPQRTTPTKPEKPR